MNKAGRYTVFVILGLTICGCLDFKREKEPDRLARVHDSYLYKNDVIKKLPKNISPEDSAVFVQNQIKRWATQQLLIDGAKRNLSEKKQEEFEKLVDEYRQELYTEAYKDIIISEKIDTSLSERKIKEYYRSDKTNFRLNKDLLKLRYIKLSKNFPAIDEIKKQLKRFNTEDQMTLKNESLKFDSFSLNDSTWVSAQDFYPKIPSLKEAEKDKILKKDKYIQLNDSLSLYLIFIKDVRLRSERAPLSYVKPALKQILLNKRKLTIEKELEKDITKDAIENKTFEIYN